MAELTQSSIKSSEFLDQLYDENWFKEGEQGLVYLRYYSMPFEPTDDFYIPGLDGETVEFSGAPFRIIVAHISEQKYISNIPWLITSDSRKPKITVESISRMLPSSVYILVSTPIYAEEDTYENASIRMDGFAGMLRIIGGNNLLSQFVREGTVDVSSGDIKTLTEAVFLPTRIEGPFATEETWQQLKEVTNAITSKGGSDGNRITLATQLIERAFTSKDSLKFFSYWVALEVAADTHSHGKIITLLSKAYKQKKAYIQNNLGFQYLWETRQTVFHKGETYTVPPDIERYFQNLFLDVVRKKLGLKCKRNMATMVEDGFDVNRLNRKSAHFNILTIDTT